MVHSNLKSLQHRLPLESMEWEADEKELNAAGAELLPDGRIGLDIRGWEIDSNNSSCLTFLNLQCDILDSEFNT
ncbi:hypothetical protein SSX86_024619 [Deinandra increscens subsp. villosa]|uniref:Uncharacterized protein n=1 Tax=Deinandra increscens subsp. villosa TaxID=3103831 RepID=A0AAP0CBW2_9ASTR